MPHRSLGIWDPVRGGGCTPSGESLAHRPPSSGLEASDQMGPPGLRTWEMGSLRRSGRGERAVR